MNKHRNIAIGSLLAANIFAGAASADTAPSQDLTISIQDFTYDLQQQRANLHLKNAYGKSQLIKNHKGATLTFNLEGVRIENLNDCPYAAVSIDQIKKDISYWRNTVDITIDHMPQATAEMAIKAGCVTIDTAVAQAF